MIMRRRAPDSNNGQVENEGSNNSNTDRSKPIISKAQPMVSNFTVFAVVVICLTLGVLQNSHMQHQQQQQHGNNGPRQTQAITTASDNGTTEKGGQSKQSLLTPTEDENLNRDAEGVRYHLIFSTDCSPYQHWQSFLVYYTAMKVRQPGTVTRIASGCSGDDAQAMRHWFQEDIAYMSQRFHLHLTPEFSKVEKDGKMVDYKFFNKPFGLLHWLENADILNVNDQQMDESVQDDVVILIDPDMGLLRPITNDFSNYRETLISERRMEHLVSNQVVRGKPAAQVYGFGVQWAKLDLEKIAGKGTPAKAVSREQGGLYYPVGPPYLGTVHDMFLIAQKWTEFVPKVYDQYPHLLAEMFAFCIAAAHLEMPFQLIDSLMISKSDAGGEGWPLIDAIPNQEVCEFARQVDHAKYPVPSVVHLCQRYFLQKDWFFAKRKVPSDIYECEAPLFEEPPSDLGLSDYKHAWNGHRQEVSPRMANREAFMLCYLFGLINEAAAFYKQNTCPEDGYNLKKERNLAAYLQARDGKK